MALDHHIQNKNSVIACKTIIKVCRTIMKNSHRSLKQSPPYKTVTSVWYDHYDFQQQVQDWLFSKQSVQCCSWCKESAHGLVVVKIQYRVGSVVKRHSIGSKKRYFMILFHVSRGTLEVRKYRKCNSSSKKLLSCPKYLSRTTKRQWMFPVFSIL